MDEFASIRSWTDNRQSASWQREKGVIFGIGDDAAVVELHGGDEKADSPAWDMLMTVDTMVETIHFNSLTMQDEDIGYKALASNVSDIAAMGGIPRHAVITASVPRSFGSERMRRVYDGLYACAQQYGIAVVGGDTTGSPSQLVLSVTLTGVVERGRSLYRSGAQVGDAVFVTGPLGLSAAGLDYLLTLSKQQRSLSEPELAARALELAAEHGTEALVRAHRRPRPSVEAGRLLLRQGRCHALNDVSDGLASEAWEIAEASGLSLVLNEQLLPRSASMSRYGERTGKNPLDWILYGGEDYVLVGTMPKQAVGEMKEELNRHGIPLYPIGYTEAGVPGVWLERSERERMALYKRGYNHFESHGE